MITIVEKSPLQLYSKKLVKLKSIQQIQRDLKSSEVNKLNYKIHYLNQTYIFHLIAYWQEFINELINHAFYKLTEEQNISILNNALLNNKNFKIKNFNTPNAKNIDTLFNDVLGIEKITDCWNHQDLKKEDAKGKLTLILQARHQIAHTGRTKQSLSYASNFEDMKYLYMLATLLQNKIDIVIQADKG